jgi:hypothetical protein
MRKLPQKKKGSLRKAPPPPPPPSRRPLYKRWVDIKDRLPDIDRDVLFITESYISFVYQLDKDMDSEFMAEFIRGREDTGKVTHWQYIEPPE